MAGHTESTELAIPRTTITDIMAGHTESTVLAIPRETAKRALVPDYNWSSFALSTVRIIIIMGRRAGKLEGQLGFIVGMKMVVGCSWFSWGKRAQG